jgi:hypothetical protein
MKDRGRRTEDRKKRTEVREQGAVRFDGCWEIKGSSISNPLRNKLLLN